MQMNIIRPFPSISPFYGLLFSVLLSTGMTTSWAALPECIAVIDVTDDTGNPVVGTEIMVCSGTQLTFHSSNSTPGVGQSWVDAEWEIEGTDQSGFIPMNYTFNNEGQFQMNLWMEDTDGCESNVSVTIIVLGNPGFQFGVLQPTCFGLCDGSLLGYYASDNILYYTHTWFLQGNVVGSQDISLSACAGSYNVVVTDPAGCTDVNLPFSLGQPTAIEVNIVPPGPVSMCPGDNPISLVASHENAALPLQSIAWSWPDGLSVIDQLITVFTPSSNNLNQTLDINIVDANGCEGSASIELRARWASLHGTVAIDGSPCNDCVVQCFKMSEAGAWSPYTGISSDVTGAYELGQVPGLTNCILKVIPPAGQYPNMPPMYYPNTHNWANSAIIYTGCNEATEKTFSFTSPPQLSGSTTIEGGVFYQSSGKTEAEDPIPGVDVVVEKVPPGNAMTVVTTDADGRFTFEYIEETLGDTLIRFYVDLTGVPMASTYILTIGAGDVLVEHIDFCVNEEYTEIYTCNLLSVTQLDRPEATSLSVFPNPASDVVQFKVRGSTSNVAEVVLIDLTGRTVRSLRPEASEFELNVLGLSEGLYTATVRLSDGTVLSERLMVGR